MGEDGFSIRCPHCLEWRDWREHPSELALESVEELVAILKQLQEMPETFMHPKLLRCGQQFPKCPAPSEAFVCRTEEDALRFVQAVEAWSLKRDFRLYRPDHRSRWHGYTGILFSTLPVPRQRHIQLEDLVDRELLSRAIIGFEEELRGPLSVYAAEVLRLNGDEQVIWAPIEGGTARVPPKYNAFCAICRDLTLEHLKEEFTRAKPSPSSCAHSPNLGRNNMCAGREAPCLREDWGHCPAFLLLRERKCPCYVCDRAVIEKIQAGSHLPDAGDSEPIITTCWAGFTEIGMPMIVHDHLIGVAMTGQLVVNPSDLVPPADLVTKCPWLAPALGRLRRFHEIWKGDVKPSPANSDEGRVAEFGPVNMDEVNRRQDVLRQCVVQIFRVARSNYYRIRERSESIFEQELRGRIENDALNSGFFEGPVLGIVERMRAFWAFKAVHLWLIPQGSQDLRVVAFSTKTERTCFGLRGPTLGRLPWKAWPTRAQPMFFDNEDRDRMKSVPASAFLPLLKRAIAEPSWHIPQGRCYYFVLAPIADYIFAFMFAVRDEEAVSPFGLAKPRGVSPLAQELILQTCTHVVHSLGGVWFRQARERAWQEFSAHASHRIGNELNTVASLLHALQRDLRPDSPLPPKWHDHIVIMQSLVSGAKDMLAEQAKLTPRLRPNLQPVDVHALLQTSMIGVLPPSAQFTVDVARGAARAHVDPSLIGQALRELAFNAVRAGGNRIRVTVKATVNRQDTPTGPEKWLRISFENSGPPIPRGELARIFQQGVSKTPGGTGIGLVTVQRIAEAHGGSVHAESVDEGARFIITLPLNGGRS